MEHFQFSTSVLDVATLELLLSLSYSQIDSGSDLMVVKFACLDCEERDETLSFFTSYPSRNAQARTHHTLFFSAACPQSNTNCCIAKEAD
jgi:hypothetical protein